MTRLVSPTRRLGCVASVRTYGPVGSAVPLGVGVGVLPAGVFVITGVSVITGVLVVVEVEVELPVGRVGVSVMSGVVVTVGVFVTTDVCVEVGVLVTESVPVCVWVGV